MNKSNREILRFSMVAAMLSGLAGAASAQVDLNGVGYVQYGDASSYSMPFAIIDECGGKAPGCQYNVTSTPGAIQDLVVIATGTNSNPTTTNFVGMDNAYSTPTGVNGSTYFTTNPTTDRGSQGTIADNDPNTWDSTLAALKTFLTVDGTIFQPVFFFNNNQTNSGGAATESLAAWMRVTITDASGAIVALADPNLTGVYDLTNHDGAYKLVTEGGGGVFNGDAANYTSDGSAPRQARMPQRTTSCPAGRFAATLACRFRAACLTTRRSPTTWVRTTSRTRSCSMN